MSIEHVAFVVAATGLFFFSLGTWYGKVSTVQGLLIGVFKPDRTPHKFGDGFYYVVPEREYNQMSRSFARSLMK